MNVIVLEIVIILALILLNGILSMSELAVVSARKSRLEQKVEDGDKRAAKALALAENPNRFLSTVQIGITSIGILSGAFGGATIAENISTVLNKVSWLAGYGETIGVAIVVLSITFLSLVLGELVPKRLALNNAEKIAVAVSPAMHALSVANTPVVAVLSASTDFILRILGVKNSPELEITEDDLKSMLDQGTEAGVFEVSEQDMVERIFRLSDRNVSVLMTPRTDVVFLDIKATHEEIFERISSHPYTRFPVFQETSDNVIGIVTARDILFQRLEGQEFDVRKALQQPLFVPETTGALAVLEQFKTSGVEIAIVIDEYGGVLGLVSMHDILEAIVGSVANPEGEQGLEAVQREDGSWLFDGMLPIDELKDLLGMDALPDEDILNYETLSGFVMAILRRIPSTGDHFDWGGFRFEVVDMDNRRVDKVLVALLPESSSRDG
jgi:putative hemolysin